MQSKKRRLREEPWEKSTKARTEWCQESWGRTKSQHGGVVNSLECYKKLKRIRADWKSSDWSISRSLLVIFAIVVSVVQQRKELGWRGRKNDYKIRNWGLWRVWCCKKEEWIVAWGGDRFWGRNFSMPEQRETDLGNGRKGFDRGRSLKRWWKDVS